MEFPDSCIRVTDLPGGIGLTSDGLSAIRSVLLEPRTVITVENLTTYHDIPQTIEPFYIWVVSQIPHGQVFFVWFTLPNRMLFICIMEIWIHTVF